jgi:HNH endonuclease
MKNIPKALQMKAQMRVDRFWSYVSKAEGCWLWTGGKSGDGYGAFYVDEERPIIRAHVFSFELAHGYRPKAHVCHHCDVPACVRPDHLFEGSQADNMRDKAKKGRSSRGYCNPRTKLTAAQVILIRSCSAPGVAIARHLNVCPTAISNIRHGRTWAWL